MYDWIWGSQVSWVQARSRQVPAPNSALAFFHIPLPEFFDAAEVGNISGTWHESPPPWGGGPNINSGLFAAMLEDAIVKAAFVGHDHNNDFCVDAYSTGINLCYDGAAGYQAYGRPGWQRRMRVTELRDWGRAAASWKRGANGQQIDSELLYNGTEKMVYPIRRKVNPPKFQSAHADRWARADAQVSII